MKFQWRRETILLTGGTGSFGQKFTEIMLARYHPKAIRIFSRDEWKQWEMEKRFKHERLRFFIGDVRDRERIRRAMEGVTLVVHAAALKHVPLCEYNPFEAIQTNVVGAQNIINAAIDVGVSRVMALSTDKAVNPVNLYGATKLCAEKLFVNGNFYAGTRDVRLSCVRYGNVIGSRGSLVPLFKDQMKTGRLTVTDKEMTRFWISLEEGVDFVIRCIEKMQGSEIFIPKIPSMKIVEIARLMAPQCKVVYTGVRPGEKLHEVLLSHDEARTAFETEGMYVIYPENKDLSHKIKIIGKKVPLNFHYTSDGNTRWLGKTELLKMIS